jgi:4'-phosphopantetheinyl transferase
MPPTQHSPDPELRIEVAELSRDSLLAPPELELYPTSIHIWQFPLTTPEDGLDVYASILSPDERVRADRFHFERDRRRFTIARATVRSILGAYVKSRPTDIVFEYAHYGKPSLADSRSGIRFSVSHSDETGLLAVAHDKEVGVDVELIRPDVETDQLAERFFSPYERESIRALSTGKRVSAFFRCWTCKEAFLKVQGLGLSRSLDSFDVEVNPEVPARLLATRPDARESVRWFLYDIPIESRYRAAVAVEGLINGMKILRCR